MEKPYPDGGVDRQDFPKQMIGEKCHWSQLKALKVERILICPNEPGGRICRSRWSLVDDGKLSLERFDLQENIA